jgi:drug/metabolite transporter (DMT)-like permease
VIFQLGGSVPFLLVGAALFGELGRFPDATAVAWLGLAYQTVIVAFASYLLWFWLLLAYPAAKVSGFTFLTPVFGVASGSLVLGEPISAALLAGLGAIAVGLRLVNRPAPA